MELAHKDISFLHHHARMASSSTRKSASIGRDGRKGMWPCKERLEAGRALLTCWCWAAGGRWEEG